MRKDVKIGLLAGLVLLILILVYFSVDSPDPQEPLVPDLPVVDEPTDSAAGSVPVAESDTIETVAIEDRTIAPITSPGPSPL